MKKLLLILALGATTLFASVGQIAAVKGEASIDRAGTKLMASPGLAVEEKDKILSESGSRVQVLFNDKTVVTIGSQSVFEVEKYLFDEPAGKAEAKFGFTKGAFKTLTGKIGQVAPDRFTMKTRTATIGIRGTGVLGKISDNREMIACTEGAIAVEAGGSVVELTAGEMTSFLAGAVPGAPRDVTPEDLQDLEESFGVDPALARKIRGVKLAADLSFDEEAVADVVSEISQIKEADARMAALYLLEDTLFQQLDEQAENYGEKVPVDAPLASYEGYRPLEWGFYTEELPVSNSDEDIITAVPDDVWASSPNNDRTSAEKVESYIDGHTVATYTGRSMGYVEKNGLFSIIRDNDNNKVDLTFDFGNQMIVGSIGFEALEPGTGETREWLIKVGSAGSTVLNTTGFDGIDFWDSEAEGTVALDYVQFFYNRYFGEESYQVNGYFQAIADDDQEAYGMFIGNKTGEFQLSQATYEAGTKFSWGYWLDGEVDGQVTTQLPDGITAYGAWVEGEKTPESYLANLQSASYKGGVIGSVYDIDTGSVDLMERGSVQLEFDFSKASMSGSVSFIAGEDRWAVNVTQGTVEGNGFEGTTFSDAGTGNVKTLHREMSGSFYRDDALFTGGNFVFTGDNGGVATGAFKGVKQ